MTMLGHYFLSYWQKIWLTVKCAILRLEIWFLLHSDRDEIVPGKVSRAVALQKLRYPNRSQIWYLKKVLEDLRC